MSHETDDQQEKFRRATISTLKVIAGAPDIEVNFDDNDFSQTSEDTVSLPTPPSLLTDEQTGPYRGRVDSLALRLKYHDDHFHLTYAPKDNQARAIYDILEQARYECLGTKYMPGIASNLYDALNEHCKAQGYQNILRQNDAPLHEAVGFFIRDALLATQMIPTAAKNVSNFWREELQTKITPQTIQKLALNLEKQSDFSRAIFDLLEELEFKISDSERPPASESSSDNSENSESDAPPSEKPENGQEEANTSMPMTSAEQEETQTGSQESLADLASDLENLTDDDLDALSQIDEIAEHLRPYADDHDGATDYKIYTNDFDETVPADELCRPRELARLRQMLDKQLTHLQSTITKLANRLQRKLMAQQNRHWKFDLEEGILDSSRLARVVANPAHSLSYKEETDTEFKDTVVSLLLDNSGSMRGRPITITAISADILARTLERCGVKVEILGFTTRTWKGGASREKWLLNGKPKDIGRLNDLRHIIYKSADTPWRHARNNLGLMLREGILKENIDGEAILWAHRRLMQRPEQRKIMMVISDGAPVDDSTLSANHGAYLDKHLRHVIDWVENASPIELTAIGIGHDVTRYYKRAVTITDAMDLGGVMMDKLTELFHEK